MNSNLLTKRSISPDKRSTNALRDNIEKLSVNEMRRSADSYGITQMFQARNSLDDIERNNHSVEIRDLNAEIHSQNHSSGHDFKKKAALSNHPQGTGSAEKFNLKYVMSLFKTVPFPSPKIEELYRRYFFHLNQHFINWFLVILILTSLCEIGLHFHYNRVSTFRYTRGIFLVVEVTVLVALLSVINWNDSSGRLLVFVSYVIVLFNCLTTIFNSVPLQGQVHGVTASMNFVIFSIYMTYVMLPLQFRMSICCGLLITITHLITSIASKASTQKDVWWLVRNFFFLNSFSVFIRGKQKSGRKYFSSNLFFS